jgi:hypothetical protein
MRVSGAVDVVHSGRPTIVILVTEHIGQLSHNNLRTVTDQMRIVNEQFVGRGINAWRFN